VFRDDYKRLDRTIELAELRGLGQKNSKLRVDLAWQRDIVSELGIESLVSEASGLRFR
jgi:hypothetical protein